MNYYGGKELAESFRTVRKNTLAIAQDIPEDKYDFRPMPETRSVRELLAHIALSNGFQKAIHADLKVFPDLNHCRGFCAVAFVLGASRERAAAGRDMRRLDPDDVATEGDHDRAHARVLARRSGDAGVM